MRIISLSALRAFIACASGCAGLMTTADSSGTRTEGTSSSADFPAANQSAPARALDLPAQDGRIPWAAWQLRQAGGDPGTQAWARFTPCHWAVGSDHIAMRPPEALQLREDESRALLEAMTPYFTEDGLAVDWQGPLHWRARGDMLEVVVASRNGSRSKAKEVEERHHNKAAPAPKGHTRHISLGRTHHAKKHGGHR